MYSLDGRSIRDEQSFLGTFARDVPFEVFTPEDLVPPIRWDAFGDSLSSGLASRAETRGAILWEGADWMLDRKLRLLVNAVECIVSEAERLMRYDPPSRFWSAWLRTVLTSSISPAPTGCSARRSLNFPALSSTGSATMPATRSRRLGRRDRRRHGNERSVARAYCRELLPHASVHNFRRTERSRRMLKDARQRPTAVCRPWSLEANREQGGPC